MISKPGTCPGPKKFVWTKKFDSIPDQLDALIKIVGPDNVKTDNFERAYHSFGKFYTDLLKLRQGTN